MPGRDCTKGIHFEISFPSSELEATEVSKKLCKMLKDKCFHTKTEAF